MGTRRYIRSARLTIVAVFQGGHPGWMICAVPTETPTWGARASLPHGSPEIERNRRWRSSEHRPAVTSSRLPRPAMADRPVERRALLGDRSLVAPADQPELWPAHFMLESRMPAFAPYRSPRSARLGIVVRAPRPTEPAQWDGSIQWGRQGVPFTGHHLLSSGMHQRRGQRNGSPASRQPCAVKAEQSVARDSTP